MDLEPVGRFLWGLVPQKDDDAVALYNWRWKSVALGVATLGLAVYATGWIPFLSPGYARAEAVLADNTQTNRKIDHLSGKVDDLSGKVVAVLSQQHDEQVAQNQRDLLEARRYQCRGQGATGDRSTLAFWNSRMSELKLHYQQLTGDTWADQDCNSF